MTQFVAVFFALSPVVFFLHSNMIYVSVPLGSAVACTASVCLKSYTHNICHASSKITGMRGAKAGGSPPRRSPLGTYV